MSAAPRARPWGLLWLLVLPALIYVALRRVDGASLRQALAGVRAGPLCGFVLVHLVLVATKARRLRLILRECGAAQPPGSPWLLALYLGSYAADNLVFSQAGVGTRVLLLRRAGLPTPVALASQVLDKLAETLGLVSLALLALPFLLRRSAELGLRLPSGAALGGLVVGVLAAGAAVVLLARRLGRGSLQQVLKHGGERAPLCWLEIALWTLLGWGLELGLLQLACAALHVVLPVSAAGLSDQVLFLLLVSLSMLVPGLPANVGPFEAGAVLGLRALGVPMATALPLALVYHAAHTLPVTLIGIPLWRWLVLRRTVPGVYARDLPHA